MGALKWVTVGLCSLSGVGVIGLGLMSTPAAYASPGSLAMAPVVLRAFPSGPAGSAGASAPTPAPVAAKDPDMAPPPGKQPEVAPPVAGKAPDVAPPPAAKAPVVPPVAAPVAAKVPDVAPPVAAKAPVVPPVAAPIAAPVAAKQPDVAPPLAAKQPVAPPVAAPVAAKQPEPAAAAPAEGFLELNSSEAADVFVDGRKVGSAPVPHLKLKPGPHKVRFDCYDDAGNTTPGKAQNVVVTPEQTTEVNFMCPAAE